MRRFFTCSFICVSLFLWLSSFLLPSIAASASSTCTSDPTVVALTLDGSISAYSTISGQLQWRVQPSGALIETSQPQPAGKPGTSTHIRVGQDAADPSIPSALLVPALDGSIMLVSDMGAFQLPYTTESLLERTPLIDRDTQTVYLGSTRSAALAIDVDTGSLLWHATSPMSNLSELHEDRIPDIAAQQAAGKRVLWLTRKDVSVRALRHETDLWKFSIGSYHQVELLATGTHPSNTDLRLDFTSTRDGELLVTDAKSGAWKWQTQLPGPLVDLYYVGKGRACPRTAPELGSDSDLPAAQKLKPLPIHWLWPEDEDHQEVYIGKLGRSQLYAWRLHREDLPALPAGTMESFEQAQQQQQQQQQQRKHAAAAAADAQCEAQTSSAASSYERSHDEATCRSSSVDRPVNAVDAQLVPSQSADGRTGTWPACNPRSPAWPGCMVGMHALRVVAGAADGERMQLPAPKFLQPEGGAVLQPLLPAPSSAQESAGAAGEAPSIVDIPAVDDDSVSQRIVLLLDPDAWEPAAVLLWNAQHVGKAKLSRVDTTHMEVLAHAPRFQGISSTSGHALVPMDGAPGLRELADSLARGIGRQVDEHVMSSWASSALQSGFPFNAVGLSVLHTSLDLRFASAMMWRTISNAFLALLAVAAGTGILRMVLAGRLAGPTPAGGSEESSPHTTPTPLPPGTVTSPSEDAAAAKPIERHIQRHGETWLAIGEGDAFLKSEKVLGRGSHGTIVYAGLFHGRAVAIKVMLQQYYSMADKEIRLLTRVDSHPNIVRYYTAVQSGEFVMLALERCAGTLSHGLSRVLHARVQAQSASASSSGRFAALAGAGSEWDDEDDVSIQSGSAPAVPLPSPSARLFCLEIARGLAFLHGKGIVHRDIKPGNILLARRDQAQAARKAMKNADAWLAAETTAQPGYPSDLPCLGTAWVPKISDMGLGKLVGGPTSSVGGDMSRSTYATLHTGGYGSTRAASATAVGTTGWQAPELLERMYDEAGATAKAAWQLQLQQAGQPTQHGHLLGLHADCALDVEQFDRLPPLFQRSGVLPGSSVQASQPGSDPGTPSSPASRGESGPRTSDVQVTQSRAVDVWALGCVLYAVLDPGQHPFGKPFDREARVLRAQRDLSRLQAVTPEAADLIAAMTHVLPRARPRMDQVLEHPTFWSDEKRSSFLVDLSDRLEQAGPDHPAVLALQAAGPALFGASWEHRLPAELTADIARRRRYDFTSVLDCLRVFRNKRNHYDELSAGLRTQLGGTSHLVLVPYFATQFPRLIMVALRISLQFFAHEPHIASLLGSITARQYSGAAVAASRAAVPPAAVQLAAASLVQPRSTRAHSAASGSSEPRSRAGKSARHKEATARVPAAAGADAAVADSAASTPSPSGASRAWWPGAQAWVSSSQQASEDALLDAPMVWRDGAHPGPIVVPQETWQQCPDEVVQVVCAFCGIRTASTRFRGGGNPDSGRYKQRLCSSFEEQGWCARGARCDFAHTTLELQSNVTWNTVAYQLTHGVSTHASSSSQDGTGSRFRQRGGGRPIRRMDSSARAGE